MGLISLLCHEPMYSGAGVHFHRVLTVLHPWSSWSVCPGVEWRAKAEPPVAAPAPGHGLPRMKQKQGWSHGRESDYGGASAGAGVRGSGSGVEHTAWPEGRVSFRSAFRMPAASLLVHSDCIQPGRSHHGQGRGQKWTCLEGGGGGKIIVIHLSILISSCRL